MEIFKTKRGLKFLSDKFEESGIAINPGFSLQDYRIKKSLRGDISVKARYKTQTGEIVVIRTVDFKKRELLLLRLQPIVSWFKRLIR